MDGWIYGVSNYSMPKSVFSKQSYDFKFIFNNTNPLFGWLYDFHVVFTKHFYHWHDSTPGQFLSGVQLVSIKSFPSRVVVLSRLKNIVCHTHSWRENLLIDAFPKRICAKCRANILVEDLNSGHQFHFQRQ